MPVLLVAIAVEAGESAVPGPAAAILAAQSEEFVDKLGLNTNSKVLVIGTEGATDPGVARSGIGSY